MREVTHRYEDPLDRVWIGCAQRIGLRVVRDPGAFATTDGRGTLAIATAEGLDADDCLAQMIFHELCHSLVQGPQSFEEPDWGLENQNDRDEDNEKACLRVQAALTRPLGLSRALAPTTDFRAFWDTLGPDPLWPLSERSVVMARRAAGRVERAPWNPHLREALSASAAILQAAAPYARDDEGARSLLALVDPPLPTHALGFPMPPPTSRFASARCEDCGWAQKRGSGLRCAQAERPVKAYMGACERFEPQVRCEDCGACCREAFDTVVVGAREPVRKRHPQLVVARGEGFEIPRQGRCPPLQGQGTDAAPYRCGIYEDRPRTCRDFGLGGQACLAARRRVGLSL